jgi:serine/threonine-protein kinase
MSETSLDAGSGSGKYRTLFELGQGGTANVSLSVAQGPEGFKKLFVVKSLRSIYAQDPEFRAMFMTEARLSARLNHPNVVSVYEVFEQQATPTILMEYIEGQTLDSILALPEPKLPLELHLRILADVLSGLHYSHELLDLKHEPLNVVHRDVSPHNVMVSYEGTAKILDFGIAKLSGSTVETDAGVIKGKLRYMPPEQIAGEEVDRRADVFAVGVMLWEALSGTKLWKGLPDATIMNRVLSGEIPKPKHPSQALLPELEAICMRALAPARDERYQTALDLELALEDYLAKRSHYVSAREISKFMCERFADARRSVEQRIEAELLRGESAAAVALERTRSITPSHATYSTSRTDQTEPRSRLWIPALLLLGVGALIVLTGLRDRSASDAPVTHPVTNVAEVREPTAAPPNTGSDPVAQPPSAPSDSAAPLGSTPAPAVSSRPKAASSGARVARPASSKPNAACDPPYFLDERGIKKFKRECL